MTPRCPNRIDPDEPDSAPCGDEGRLCEECDRMEGEKWRAHFGPSCSYHDDDDDPRDPRPPSAQRVYEWFRLKR